MAMTWWQWALGHVRKPWGGSRRLRRPSSRRSKSAPRLELLEDRTVLTGPVTSPGVSLTTVEVQPSGALASNAFVDVPGLKTTVAAAGTYHVSASVNVQNTSASAGTEVGVDLVLNGTIVDSRVLSFAPGSPTFQQSLSVEGNLALTAGELVEVQAAALGNSGSAQYPGANSTQDLRLIRFATPPVVANPGNQADLAGDPVALAIAASNAAAPLTYRASGLPAGLAINSATGVIFGMIDSQAAGASPYTVIVTASDGFNSGSTTFTWTVSPVVSPPPPPAKLHISASLITRKVGRKRALFIHLTFSDGRAAEDVRSPFQPPSFRGVTVVVKDANGDGSDDSLLLSARKGKKAVTRILGV
jgi:hypothetical protein